MSSEKHARRRQDWLEGGRDAYLPIVTRHRWQDIWRRSRRYGGRLFDSVECAPRRFSREFGRLHLVARYLELCRMKFARRQWKLIFLRITRHGTSPFH